MLLKQFDGGVSSRLAPQLLQPNQGVVYKNIDNSTGVLSPLKDKVLTTIPAFQYVYYFNAEDTFLSAINPTSFVEYQKALYQASGTSIPQVFQDGATRLLGIAGPTSTPNVTVVDDSPTIDQFTVIVATGGGDLPNGDLKYMLVNTDDSSGIQSIPYVFVVKQDSVTTPAITGNKQLPDAPVYNFNPISTSATGDIIIYIAGVNVTPGATAFLYRQYSNEWYLVGSTSGPIAISDSVYDISGNAPFVDAITSFNGTYTYVYTYYNSTYGVESTPSPLSSELELDSGAIELFVTGVPNDNQVTERRIYRVGGATTQFTMVAALPLAQLTYVDYLKDSDLPGPQLTSDNYYQAPTELKYLTQAYAMLFGAVGSTLRFTPVGIPTAWPPEYSLSFDNEITGVGPVANGILVFTKYKTYLVTGTGPFSLSQQLLRGDQGCINNTSVQQAGFGTLIWASQDGLCTSSGNNVTSLTKDRLGDILLTPISSVVHNEMYYCLNSDNSILVWDYRFQPIAYWLDFAVESLVIGRGTIYGWLNGYLHELYKDTENISFEYKSPLFTEGSFSNYKTYKKFYIRSEGDIMFKIFIDNEEVYAKNLTGTETHMVQVPSIKQRGYSMYFEISGTGTVEEIGYTAGTRQNE